VLIFFKTCDHEWSWTALWNEYDSRNSGLFINCKCCKFSKYIHHHQHNHFTALFPGPPKSVNARRELLDFMVQGKTNRGRHTDHPAGRHSIRTKQSPPPPSLIFMPDALPAATLPIYPGLGQAPNMLAYPVAWFAYPVAACSNNNKTHPVHTTEIHALIPLIPIIILKHIPYIF